MRNPAYIQWQAPTHEVDGSAITRQMTYILGVVDETGLPQDIASFPGTLNPDGTYVTATSDLSVFDLDGDYEIALAAQYIDGAQERSAWSNRILHTFDRPSAPQRPTLLDL